MRPTRRSTPSRCAKTDRWRSTRRSCSRTRRSEPGRRSAAAASRRTSPIATAPTSPRPSRPPASRRPKESAQLATRDGALTITPYPNGPLGVAGPVEIISGTGRTVNRVERTALCRCGHSANKPYCDGDARENRVRRAVRARCEKGDVSMLTRDEDVLAAAESWREAGRDVAIATVVETWGSAPAPDRLASRHRRRRGIFSAPYPAAASRARLSRRRRT